MRFDNYHMVVTIVLGIMMIMETSMNALLLLTPKNQLKFLDASNTAFQGVEKMRVSGYTAIPVVDGQTGVYVGTVSQGDFLWKLVDSPNQNLFDLKQVKLIDLIDSNQYKPMHVQSSMDEVVEAIMNQNFIPLVDDRGVFMGIVTRRKVIEYYFKKEKSHNE